MARLISLNRRNKRAVLILGSFLGIYLIVFYVIFPFNDQAQAIGAQIGQKELQLRQALEAVDQQRAYGQELASIDQALGAFRSQLLEAADANSAIVQIEETVRTLASQNNVTVTRSNPLPERKIGEEYSKIVLQMNLDSDLDSLVNFLHAISVQPKYLLVEEFNLASFRVREQIRIQPRMQVAGFIRLSQP